MQFAIYCRLMYSFDFVYDIKIIPPAAWRHSWDIYLPVTDLYTRRYLHTDLRLISSILTIDSKKSVSMW